MVGYDRLSIKIGSRRNGSEKECLTTVLSYIIKLGIILGFKAKVTSSISERNSCSISSPKNFKLSHLETNKPINVSEFNRHHKISTIRCVSQDKQLLAKHASIYDIVKTKKKKQTLKMTN